MIDPIKNVTMPARGRHCEEFAAACANGYRWTFRIIEGADLVHLKEIPSQVEPCPGRSDVTLEIIGRGHAGFAIIQAGLVRPWEGCTPICLSAVMVELADG